MFRRNLPYSLAPKDSPLMSRSIIPPKGAKLGANRRAFLKTTLIGSAAATLSPLYPAVGAAREIAPAVPAPEIKSFELDEITISSLQDGMTSGKFTARS